MATLDIDMIAQPATGGGPVHNDWRHATCPDDQKKRNIRVDAYSF